MTPQKLLDQIRAADSVEEVKRLLDQGATFTEASERTRKRWKRKAKQRLSQLGHSGDTCE